MRVKEKYHYSVVYFGKKDEYETNNASFSIIDYQDCVRLHICGGDKEGFCGYGSIKWSEDEYVYFMDILGLLVKGEVDEIEQKYKMRRLAYGWYDYNLYDNACPFRIFNNDSIFGSECSCRLSLEDDLFQLVVSDYDMKVCFCIKCDKKIVLDSFICR